MLFRQLIKKIVYRIRGEYTVETLVQMGLTVGKNFQPQLGVNLDPSHCWLITIGDDVTMAPRVQILAHDASTVCALGHAKIGQVNIGNRVFIGAGSIVLPNVTIGNDVIVGAGSVVTHSIPDDSVCVGNPARRICSMTDYMNKHRKLMETCPVYGSEYTLREDLSQEMKVEQKKALENTIGYVE